VDGRGSASDDARMRDAWWDLVHGSSCCACGRPGRILCPECAADLPRHAEPVRPDPAPAGLVPCFAAGPYADPLRTMILRHKERGAHGLARPLGRVLGGVVSDLLTAFGDGVGVILVPVPSTAGTVRRRGHDPMLRIARVASAQVRASRPATIARLLRLWQPVADQAGLDHAARARNLCETMVVRAQARHWLSGRSASPRGDLLLICDDVLTTGATAREAQRALQAAGLPCAAVATIAATRRRVAQVGSGGAGVPRSRSEFPGSLP